MTVHWLLSDSRATKGASTYPREHKAQVSTRGARESRKSPEAGAFVGGYDTPVRDDLRSSASPAVVLPQPPAGASVIQPAAPAAPARPTGA